jgi:poly-gamma-glutamate synthesis protein (capsule biosynthesis protein)
LGVTGFGGRKQEKVSERQDSSRGLAHLSFSLDLIVSVFLILVPLIVLTVLSRTVREAPPDLSPFPWIYLRDGRSLDPDEAVVEVMAVGDVYPGRGAVRDPLEHVRPWLRGADLTVGNLECVIVGASRASSGGPDRGGAGPPLRAPPFAVAGLSDAGFDILGLANNHALDLGGEGLSETAFHLGAAGIDVIGAGPVDDPAPQPLIQEVSGIRLAFLAFNGLPDSPAVLPDAGWSPVEWNRDRAVEAVAAARDRADAVIASVHWGYEYEMRVDPAQRDAARALLEAGADLVIGHHPHVVQAIEVNAGRAVAYSLGNFVFDQPHPEAQRGLVVRAFFDEEGLRALQALPVRAGPRPQLMTPEDSESLVKRVGPSPRRLQFTCDVETCRLAEGSGGTALRAASGPFWGGSVDLTGDGSPEDVRRVREQVIIYQDGSVVWRSPPAWRVTDVALGDPNDDGRSELMLALWKPGLDGLEPPDPAKRNTPRSRPFIVGYRGGTYGTLWGGSAVADPIQELTLGDVDGDGAEELIVLEGEERQKRTVSVWRWHGWGFSLVWRSRPGSYRDLTLSEDGSIGVTVE